MKTGSCLCGGVAYALTGPLRPSVACHCGQCRKTSGHYWSATQVAADAFTLTSSETLAWFASSDQAKRGFCNRCGSSMFWMHDGDGGAVSVASGTLDGPTGLHTDKHIFVKDKGDYYEIGDGTPQIQKY